MADRPSIAGVLVWGQRCGRGVYSGWLYRL